MMHVSEGELKEFITDSGLVARKEIDAAAKEAKERSQSLGDILVSRGSLSEDALRRIQAYVLGIPFVNLKDHRISIDVLALIPEPIARTHNIIAFKKEGDSLEVAMLDVEDLASIDSVRTKTGFTILPRLTDTESVTYALVQYRKSLKNEFGNVISAEARKIRATARGGAHISNNDLKKMAEDLPIVRIVDTLLRHAIVQGASDIHIEPQEAEVLVRYRINGSLHDAMMLPNAAAAGIVARIKVLSGLKLGEQRLPQDGRFLMETETERVSFRVSLLPASFGEKMVLRVLRETGEGFTLESLGLHGEGLERIHHALQHASGLILVSGPAGSGTTTTLYTMLDILNRPEVNISTIEDPIKYQMKRVNQAQTDPQNGFTFVSGLRSLMRQDSDIIMVDGLRDSETAALAVNAALAGRLVLAAIRADSAAEAISRLIALGVEPTLLAPAIRVVVNQRLVRRLYKNKEERTDGYKGRIGIYETLIVSPALRDLILHSSARGAIEAQAKKEGMVTLLEDGLSKAARGITSAEEVRRALAA